MSKGTAARVGTFCVVAWLSLVAFVPAATACTCIQSESPCADLRQADAVFEAVVDRVVEGPGFVEQIPGAGGRPAARVPEYLVSFRDGQSLAGAPVDRVLTSTKEEACGFAFEPGARYLVVAFRRPADGAFIVSLCSQTRRIQSDDPMHRRAPSLKAGAPTGQVWGTVLLGEAQPVPGARVTTEGPLTRRATTGSDGRYVITGLPPGRYTVSVRPPRALAAATAASVSISIDPETRCAEINPVLRPGRESPVP